MDFTKLECEKQAEQRVDKRYVQIKMVANWDTSLFKNTPIYEVLENRKLLSRLLLKSWIAKDWIEAFEHYNRMIKQYLILED